jgi:hypothetical protein
VDNPVTCTVEGTVKGMSMVETLNRNLPQV